MHQWLNGPGAAFKDPLPGSTNYLSAYNNRGKLSRATVEESSPALTDSKDSAESSGEKASSEQRLQELNYAGPEALPPERPEDLVPFPLNKRFRSQAVLSEELKDEIWNRVVLQGKSVQTVSTELLVDMRRVGAVVRLKTVEKQWVEQGKPLAMPYAKAILGMLPQTHFTRESGSDPHESINDLPVHHATLDQLFYPVSESRHFTRRDAGKVFDRHLLPAEDRIAHPHLVELEKLKLAGASDMDANALIKQKMKEKEAQREASRQELREREKRLVTKVHPGGNKARAEFRFREISVELVGKDGRDRRGVGMRYGLPAQDRKKGQIKIPRKVGL